MAQEVLTKEECSSKKVLKRFDFLCHEYRAQHPQSSDIIEGFSTFNLFFFSEKAFRGLLNAQENLEDFYFLKILEHREGHVLPLALLYQELASRLLSQETEVVSVTDEYFLKLDYNEQSFFLDMANKGRLLSVNEIQDKLKRIKVINKKLFDRPSDLQILSQIFRKLKWIYFKNSQWPELLTLLDMHIEAIPHHTNEFKERGLLLYQLGVFDEAYKDLSYFLKVSEATSENQKLKNLISHMEPQAPPP